MSEKAFAIGPNAKYKKMNTLTSETGKIKENKFSVGADLVIIPPAIFINNMPPTTGNMIKAVKYNILPNAMIPALLTSVIFNDIPIGRKI